SVRQQTSVPPIKVYALGAWQKRQFYPLVRLNSPALFAGPSLGATARLVPAGFRQCTLRASRPLPLRTEQTRRRFCDSQRGALGSHFLPAFILWSASTASRFTSMRMWAVQVAAATPPAHLSMEVAFQGFRYVSSNKRTEFARKAAQARWAKAQ